MARSQRTGRSIPGTRSSQCRDLRAGTSLACSLSLESHCRHREQGGNPNGSDQVQMYKVLNRVVLFYLFLENGAERTRVKLEDQLVIVVQVKNEGT